MPKTGVSLQDVLAVTTRIEDKIDRLHDELEPRVGSLERWRAEITGKMAILAAVVSVAFTSGWEYIRKRIT